MGDRCYHSRAVRKLWGRAMWCAPVAGTRSGMVQLTGGQALVQSIKREGVDTIFGLPGVQLDWAFDALYEERDNIRVVHTRHEQATSYMADGYARVSGKVGTCLVVPGPRAR